MRLISRLGIHVSKPPKPEDQEETVDEAQEEMEQPSLPQPEIPLPAARSPHPKSSDEMFAALGAQLSERREALNLRREEIERHIHIRAHYLQALEEGDFGGLPSAVQTRGMLNNYATFLDLDVEALLLDFADILQVQHRERHPLPPGARGRPAPNAPLKLPPVRGFMVADFMAIGVMLLLVVFLVWGLQFVLQKNKEAKAATPAVMDVLLEPSMAAPTSHPASTAELLDLGAATATVNPNEVPVELPTVPEGVTVQINIIAVERTFLRVTVDGDVAFDGRVMPGTAYPFDGATQIEVLAGNGAALRLTYNQHDLGLLGGYGEVVDLIYRADGVITPTPTIGPSPTITLTPTIIPSQTPTPTSTPAP